MNWCHTHGLVPHTWRWIAVTHIAMDCCDTHAATHMLRHTWQEEMDQEVAEAVSSSRLQVYTRTGNPAIFSDLEIASAGLSLSLSLSFSFSLFLSFSLSLCLSLSLSFFLSLSLSLPLSLVIIFFYISWHSAWPWRWIANSFNFSLRVVYKWGVNSIVTKHSDHFFWKDTSNRVTWRCDHISLQEGSKFLCIKHLFFWGSSATKKIAKKTQKCDLRCAAHVTCSKFRDGRRNDNPSGAAMTTPRSN